LLKTLFSGGCASRVEKKRDEKSVFLLIRKRENTFQKALKRRSRRPLSDNADEQKRRFLCFSLLFRSRRLSNRL